MFYFTCNESKICECFTFWNKLQEKNNFFMIFYFFRCTCIYSLFISLCVCVNTCWCPNTYIIIRWCYFSRALGCLWVTHVTYNHLRAHVCQTITIAVYYEIMQLLIQLTVNWLLSPFYSLSKAKFNTHLLLDNSSFRMQGTIVNVCACSKKLLNEGGHINQSINQLISK